MRVSKTTTPIVPEIVERLAMQPACQEDSPLAHMASPEAVRELERHLMQMPQVDMATHHLVHGRMYARTIVIPAGVMLTGALTNCDNICVLHGDISVTTDDGTVRLTGFHVLPARAGFKRAGLAHADTYWTMLCHTDLTEVRDIEDAITSESHLLQTRRDGIEYDQTLSLKGD